MPTFHTTPSPPPPDEPTYPTHQLPGTLPEEMQVQGGNGLICGHLATQGQSHTVLRPSSGHPGNLQTETFCVRIWGASHRGEEAVTSIPGNTSVQRRRKVDIKKPAGEGEASDFWS